MSWAEKDGTFTNTDRRVQRVRQALPPRGDTRPDWQILCSLAKRIENRLDLPVSAGWDYQSPEEIMAEISSGSVEYAGIRYERIEKTGLQVPVWDEHHPGTPFLFAEEFPRGRGKFHPLEFVPPVEDTNDEYPYILTTGRVLEHWHGGSMTRHSQLDVLNPEALVEINPVDAELLGVLDGQSVRVASRRGSIVLRGKGQRNDQCGCCIHPLPFRRSCRQPAHH